MHHSRRKSGHGVGNTSMTDVRRAVTATDPTRFKRPSTLSRRTTPVSSAQKLGRNPREREREWQESYDERESFPQYCMACEKQFLPHDDKFLYCSEACRMYDQDAGAQDDLYRRGAPGAHVSHHALYSVDYSEPRDIIPRASPSRPSSTNFSPPTSPGTMSSHYHHQQHHSSAISALRSLNVHPPSPPSPDGSQPSLWPFTKTAATSPSTSYNRSGSGFFSSTYDTGYGTAGHGYNYSTSGMDRPLPTRRPTGYSRPKSIELVTPMVGR